jgi:hypothetical protein
VPRGDKQWLKRHEEFVAEAKAGKVGLLFVGDSITDFWRSAGKETWDKEFAAHQPANFGIAGDLTQSRRARSGTSSSSAAATGRSRDAITTPSSRRKCRRTAWC